MDESDPEGVGYHEAAARDGAPELFAEWDDRTRDPLGLDAQPIRLIYAQVIAAQRRIEALEAENGRLLNACELAMRYLTRLHERPGCRLEGEGDVGNALLDALQRARRS